MKKLNTNLCCSKIEELRLQCVEKEKKNCVLVQELEKKLSEALREKKEVSMTSNILWHLNEALTGLNSDYVTSISENEISFQCNWILNRIKRSTFFGTTAEDIKHILEKNCDWIKVDLSNFITKGEAILYLDLSTQSKTL